MNKLYYIFGSPRSGTTHLADLIREQQNTKSIIFDEIDLSRLIFYNNAYYKHVDERSSLIRETSKNENFDRFHLAKRNFIESELTYRDLLDRFVFNNRVVIIKHPRGLENINIFRFLTEVINMGIPVYVIKCDRNFDEIFDSMVARKMYFSNHFPLSILSKQLVKFYADINCTNNISLSKLRFSADLNIVRTSSEEVAFLKDQFQKFPLFLKIGLELFRILRILLGRKFW